MEKWTGDLDGMVQRRMIRVLVAFSRTQFWVEKGKPQGMIYESFKAYKLVLDREARRRKAHETIGGSAK